MLTPSTLSVLRGLSKPPVPSILENLSHLAFSKQKLEGVSSDVAPLFPHTSGHPLLRAGKRGEEAKFSPLKVGVLFSGGPAAGGHNVICGLLDALKTLHPGCELVGFLEGPDGILKNAHKPLPPDLLVSYRNQGGFDLIGSGRGKIETEEQLQTSLNVVQNLKLDGLVIIGGDDSNTNAAVLAEYFLAKNCKTKVIGVPKTIDGDLQNPYVAISFGFDTACKTYSELIGNIARDALSSRKYYHFIKLMGRSASHITLECALATHPNLALIGEECAAKKKGLNEIVDEICALVIARAKKGKNYGTILIPEGLIEFLPNIQAEIPSFPQKIQEQLLLEKDAHGNIPLSAIETEYLLIEKVKEALKKADFKGKFSPISHFFGYEGRCAFPSFFDANYCYALGMTAALLLMHGNTGYMAFVEGLTKPPAEWQVGGVPLTHLMHIETRKGKPKPVIKKALVDLSGKPFSQFQRARDKWKEEECYLFPGPLQFFGPPSLTDPGPSCL